MKHLELLENVTEEILSDEIHYQSLRDKLHEFIEFLNEISDLEIYDPKNEENIQFKNGIALNTKDAALCVVDIMRTRQFVRGIFKAVNQKRSRNLSEDPIKILYAGTGPFAMLVLPLLTRFRSHEIQLTLLEVNQETGRYLKRVIKQLEIEDYIKKIIFTDASTYQIENDANIDLLISETMQVGLVKEQQVPIMLNLMNQLNEDVIMIPQKIQLDLALMNTSSEVLLGNSHQPKFKHLKTVLEFDSRFIQTNALSIQESKKIELCKQLPFIDKKDTNYDKLVILTKIQVFEDEWINVDESSLTLPKSILNLESVNPTENEISMDFVIKELPDFEYDLN